MIEIIASVPKKKNIRLDTYIKNSIIGYSRTKINFWIKSSLIKVNGIQEKPSYIVQNKDKIFVNIPQQHTNSKKIEPIKMDLDIVYEDDAIAIINKPVGLVVHPGNGNPSNTLVNGLVSHYESLSDVNGYGRPGIVHRLDADTSGIIVVAKNNEAHEKLSAQFQKREVSKEYVAITWSNWKEKSGVIDVPIKRNKKDPTKFSAFKDGKNSITKYEVKREYRHLSLVKFFPETGRTHQIRVHSSYNGNPIFGDKKYGGSETKTKGFLPELNKIYKRMLNEFKGHALHAKSISFSHPKSNKMVTFDCSIPHEFQKLVNSIENYHE